ncbi:CYTH domain-containing protein [Pseudobacteriovorax antillogorgiicola]|uniref:CYTH domain-containing protein n=1 Tax=Pseudobacteriovorax antillogorgiicola TaxID=1513793 RepID=A0A1Y6B4T6_9BACT|nr:CYTH domain-containing protein [Pseudobacteriovorax antillogorgiicola]TCS59229.1 CYTH domain-containing protein [Pseudobacteriovorax antillogorgiicola]SME90311.1 CYTH domain-containing protein [Pseudobacteriovorax antillogorgiicola]
MENIEFVEIEHKFLLEDDFDQQPFLQMVERLEPSGRSQVRVSDRYYLCESNPSHIYRHRLDQEIQHLTLKGLGKDSETRIEVNLDLGLHRGDQGDRVAAFLKPLGIQWSGVIEKDVWAYYFKNCEVVYYEAHFKEKSVRCIEIEATNCQTLDEAKATIANFEKKLGLNPTNRCGESLFHLLLLPEVNAQVNP